MSVELARLWSDVQRDHDRGQRWGQALVNGLHRYGVDLTPIERTGRDPFFVVDSVTALNRWMSANLEFDTTGRYVMGVKHEVVDAKEAPDRDPSGD